MEQFQRMVNDFRKAMDLPISDYPRTLSPQEAELHIQMIRDEFEKEFVKYWMEQNLIEMYDAGIDLIVYVLGAMSHAGFDVEPGFKEIMRSNMSKMNPETGKPIKAGPNEPSGEPEGKVLKGTNYSPPNLHQILNAQFQFGAEDTTVYRVAGLPLTLGEGGPRIGSADLQMDHNGVMEIDAIVEDVDVLPMLGSVSVSDLSVYAEDIVDAEEVQDEPEPYSGPAMIAVPQEGAPNYENRPVVSLEEEPIDDSLRNVFTERSYESGMPAGVHIFPPYDR